MALNMVGSSRVFRITNLVAFINCSHPPLTLRLSDNLSGVFDDDLVGFKCTVAANTISTIRCFDNLNTNIIFPSDLGPLFQLLEASVTTFTP